MNSAAIVLIGDELLSGRVQDLNLGYMAERLQAAGIILRECRIVPDAIDSIVEAVNALREKNTYVFTTGGIGATHDDITYEAVAKAFGVPLETHPEGLKILREIYKENFNPATARLALVPKGAIVHPESSYSVANVYMFAGVPRVAKEMFDDVLKTLNHGKAIESLSVTAYVWENDIADSLRELQKRWPQVSVGSYPFNENDRWGTTLVAKGTDYAELKKIEPYLKELLATAKRRT